VFNFRHKSISLLQVQIVDSKAFYIKSMSFLQVLIVDSKAFYIKSMSFLQVLIVDSKAFYYEFLVNKLLNSSNAPSGEVSQEVLLSRKFRLIFLKFRGALHLHFVRHLHMYKKIDAR
jgi:hypothetical protein